MNAIHASSPRGRGPDLANAGKQAKPDLGLAWLRQGSHVPGSRLFRRAELEVGNGNLLRIVARRNSFAESVHPACALEWQRCVRSRVRHADLAGGGVQESATGPRSLRASRSARGN